MGGLVARLLLVADNGRDQTIFLHLPLEGINHRGHDDRSSTRTAISKRNYSDAGGGCVTVWVTGEL